MASRSTSYSETEQTSPWHDPVLLETLYWEHDLSLREIATRLGCSKTTVNRWADHHGLQLRPPNNEKRHPSIWRNPAGYSYAEASVDGDREVVAIHELVAIADGADPSEVFSPDTQVHHHLGIPGEFDAPHLDIPGNVTVMEQSEHLQKHQAGTHEQPPVEEILDGPAGE